MGEARAKRWRMGIGWALLGAAGAVALAAIWLNLSPWRTVATVLVLVVVAALVQGPPDKGASRG